jgi:hypothetical protein
MSALRLLYLRHCSSFWMRSYTCSFSSSRAFSLGKVSVIPSKLNFYSLGLDHIKPLRKPVTDVSDELIKLP